MINGYGRNRQGKTLLIVVLFMVICVFIGSLVQFTVALGEVIEGPSYVESKAVLDGDVTISYLGKNYMENAKSGYSYYKIDVPVYNNGSYEMGTGYEVRLQVETDEWDDVEEFTMTDNSDFAYSYEDLVPPATSGIAHKIYLIRDGVKEVKATFYESSDDYYDGQNGTEFVLKVPTE